MLLLAPSLAETAPQSDGDRTSVVSLWLRIGSSSDPCGKEGRAHLYEHLVPWTPYQGKPFQVICESQGVRFAAETGKDFISFTLHGRPQTVGSLVPGLLSSALNPVFGAELLQREKELIALELDRDSDDRLGLIHRHLEGVIFSGTGYAHPPSGWASGVANLSVSDFTQFMALIASAEAVLVRDGQIEPVTTRQTGVGQLVQQKHSCLPNENSLPAPSREIGWGMGWATSCSSRDVALWDLLADCLGERVGSNAMNRAEVKDWELAVRFRRHLVVLTVAATLNRAVPDLEKAVLAEMRDFAQRSFPVSMLMARVNRLVALHSLRQKNPLNRTRFAGLGWALFDDLKISDTYLASLLGTSPDAIRQVVKQVLMESPTVIRTAGGT